MCQCYGRAARSPTSPEAPATLRRMLRQCARPGCSAPATTTLSYDYAERVVWLDTLHEDDHPARHDLCGRHADRLSVPNGWRLENRRGTSELVDTALP
jgi:hypothetical protein